MKSPSRTACVLNDGDRFVHEIAELLDGLDYCIFQEHNFDRFITMIAEIDPDLMLIPEATLSADDNLLPMLRLLTDNVIAVAGYGDGALTASALLRGADLCVTPDMPDGELLARLYACERRLLAFTA